MCEQAGKEVIILDSISHEWEGSGGILEIHSNMTGNSFTATILSPLVIALDCRWIKDGTLEFSPSGKLKRTIDYGYPGGGCDKYAQVTIGNGTYVIELR